MATALLLEYENDKKGNHLLQFATKAFFTYNIEILIKDDIVLKV
jgi:hypothetical protein